MWLHLDCWCASLAKAQNRGCRCSPLLSLVNDRGDDLRAGFMMARGSTGVEVRVRDDVVS